MKKPDYFLVTLGSLLTIVAVGTLLVWLSRHALAEPPPGGVEALKKSFKGIVSSKPQEADKKKKLLKAVRAIEDRGFMHTRADCDKRHKCAKWKNKPDKKYLYKRCLRRLKKCYKRALYWQKRRLRIVNAAIKAEKKTKIDALLLIALGRMESDFRPLQLVSPRCGQRLPYGGRRTCGADCGITQHRVSGKESYVRRLCKKYAKDYDLVFLKSAQELARHVQYCKKYAYKKYHQPLRRCVLNRYNQGTFYKRNSSCKRRYRCGHMRVSDYADKKLWYQAYKRCKKSKRKCLNIAAYWVKLSCFEYGARHGLVSIKSCRKCLKYSDILKFYPPSQVSSL